MPIARACHRLEVRSPDHAEARQRYCASLAESWSLLALKMRARVPDLRRDTGPVRELPRALHRRASTTARVTAVEEKCLHPPSAALADRLEQRGEVSVVAEHEAAIDRATASWASQTHPPGRERDLVIAEALHPRRPARGRWCEGTPGVVSPAGARCRPVSAAAPRGKL